MKILPFDKKYVKIFPIKIIPLYIFIQISSSLLDFILVSAIDYYLICNWQVIIVFFVVDSRHCYYPNFLNAI